MFYYFGGKARIAAAYPPPTFETIIEPFAGGAAYAMSYVRLKSIKRVVLVEKDERVAETWRRLLGMSIADLRAYPIPAVGERTEDFLVMTTATSNAIAGCSWMSVTERQPALLRKMLRRMEPLLEAAREKVEIVVGDYRQAPDIEATWFIDPPYMGGGSRAADGTNRPQGAGYARGCDTASIDYEALGAWCRERRGQRIVCEYAGAAWLPFRHLRGSFDGLSRGSSEVFWSDPEYQLALLD